MPEPLYALIWIEKRHHRVCPDLFVSRAEAKEHLRVLHHDLPAEDVEVVRSDLLQRFFPDERLDAPDAMASSCIMHVDAKGGG